MSLMEDGGKGELDLLSDLTYKVWEGDEAKRLLLTFFFIFLFYS